MKTLLLTAALTCLAAGGARAAAPADGQQAANPVLPGFHADPEIIYAPETGRYYIYSTTDGQPHWGGWEYACFSSADLRHWRGEGTVLDAMGPQIAWADGYLWAPAIERVERGAKPQYYLYYSANDTLRHRKSIGVAVADTPTGPFRDQGQPLITALPDGVDRGQQIDVDVFTDPASGKRYLYWGNAYMAGAELNDDMVSIKPETVRVLTPQGGTKQDFKYCEGTYVFYRKGIYYFMWSVDDTRSPNYHVAYGTATSPLGPITVAKEPIVLRQRPDKKIYGTAHNAVINIPGTDEWRIVYHRIHPDFLHCNGGWHREVCISPLTFRADGTIVEVEPE